MILLLDIGNTRIKSAVWNGRKLKPGVALEHAGKPAEALQSLPSTKPEALWIAHVTGAQHEKRLSQTARAFFGVSPQFARSAKQAAGLVNAYREPERLGVDRWLALLGAWNAYGGPICVADAGTALTVDCADARGRHLGGFIAPGLLTAQKGVLGATRFATRKLDAKYHAGLGRDTESCVRQGAYLGCVGALDRASRTLGDQARKIITGGDARLLLPHLAGKWEHRPQLVLEGLLALALESH